MTLEFWVLFGLSVVFLLTVFEAVHWVVVLWQSRLTRIVDAEDLLERVRRLERLATVERLGRERQSRVLSFTRPVRRVRW